MPQVGKKQFKYTKAGKKAAKAYARESGQEVEKYYGGGNVDPFSTRNPESIIAQKEAEAVEEQNTIAVEEQNAIPETNAMDRSETYQLGGMIKPPTAPSISPQ